MADRVALPPMVQVQQQGWHALIELQERVPAHWALDGGQLVHLHCAERDANPPRPTVDVDAVVDVRAAPHILDSFTSALVTMGALRPGAWVHPPEPTPTHPQLRH